MKKLGLCSVSFRNKKQEEIIAMVKKSGLGAIEWGGDVHVSPNDEVGADLVGKLTRITGLQTPSYGSYYRCDDAREFEKVSRAACKLEAKIIRVWAGSLDSEKLDEERFNALVHNVRECADIASEREQTIAFEYHFGTANDSAIACKKLLATIDKQNVKTYWQPMYWLGLSKEEEIKQNLLSLNQLKDDVVGVHVYNWWQRERRPLFEAKDEWRAYASILGDMNYYLEFVRDDSEEQFFADAQTLIEI